MTAKPGCTERSWSRGPSVQATRSRWRISATRLQFPADLADTGLGGCFLNAEPFLLLLVADPSQNWSLPETLLTGRYRLVRAARDQAAARLGDSDPDGVLVWAAKHDEELLGSIQSWKALRPRAQFLLFLEEPPPRRALVALLQAGWRDVLEAPATVDMAAVLGSLEERIRFVRGRSMERLEAKQSIHYAGLVGESPEMRGIYDQMLRAARLNCPVLVTGETGTGKGLVAHAIHALSQRSGKPFVTVDCGCLAPTLIESELYGVARGAYTGATSDRSGLVEAAQHGTLFLDEVGDLPLGLQPKLLRLLEEGEVRKLGSARANAVDVRIISATSRQLESLIAAEQFRLDLYYRLNVLSIETPPLRQRRQDIPLLARHFASRHRAQGEPVAVSDAAIELLSEYSWPGNVRELKNCIEAAIASASSNVLLPQHLPRWFTRAAQQALPDQELGPVNLRELERRAIVRALELSSYDKLRAARMLGIGKTTLYRKLKTMGIRDTAAKPPAESYVM